MRKYRCVGDEDEDEVQWSSVSLQTVKFPVWNIIICSAMMFELFGVVQHAPPPPPPPLVEAPLLRPLQEGGGVELSGSGCGRR